MANTSSSRRHFKPAKRSTGRFASNASWRAPRRGSCTTAFLAIALLLSFLSSRQTARAQCAEGPIITTQVAPIGSQGLSSLTSWDPDGPGPERPLLVMAGNAYSGELPNTYGVIAWDGAYFRTLGVVVTSQIYASTVYNGELIVAGVFSSISGVPVRNIARFDGQTWRSLGTGVDSAYALAVYNGELIVGGTIFTAGDATVSGVARWNGTRWAPLGPGVNGTVRALHVHEGSLYAAGSNLTRAGALRISALARWDGNAWSAVGLNLSGAVRALASFRGELFAGCTAALPLTGASGVARFSGAAWTTLATTTDTNDEILALIPFRDELIAVGTFLSLGNTSSFGLARWNGSAWSNLDTGFPTDTRSPPFLSTALEYDAELFVAGNFGMTYVFPPAQGLARWNGSEWRGFVPGTVGQGAAIHLHQGKVIVGGNFSAIGGRLITDAAEWDGYEWHSLDFPYVSSAVYALATYRGDLFVGGTAGGEYIALFTRRRNDAWERISRPINGRISQMQVFQDRLILAGNFTAVDGIANTGCFGSWDGETLRAIPGNPSGRVTAMRVHADRLIAAGVFNRVGMTPAHQIFDWDGSTWRQLGSNFPGEVAALGEYRGALHAAWSLSPTEVRVGRWDGVAWQLLPGVFDAPVLSLIEYHGDLMAAGRFISLDGETSNTRARWNGTSWRRYPLRSAARAPDVLSQAVYHDEIVSVDAYPGAVWGEFGRWSDRSAVWIARPPASTTACGVAPFVQLHVLPATGFNALTYQWRRDGQPLTDGPTSARSFLAGSSLRTLTISVPCGADAGRYDCVVSHACSSVTSDPADLTVCVADVDDGTGAARCDGGVTIDDLLLYFAWFRQGDPRADTDDGTFTGTPDSGVTIDDLLYFLIRFEAGC